MDTVAASPDRPDARTREGGFNYGACFPTFRRRLLPAKIMSGGTAKAAASAELTALLTSAHAAKDTQLVEAIVGSAASSSDSQKPPSLPASALATGIPTNLVNLAAQRGHALLLARLLSLNEAILCINPAAPATEAASSAKKLTEDQKREHCLARLVSSRVEQALLAGDRELVTAAVPKYETALAEGSLLRPPLSDAIPGLVRHATAKKDKKLLDELREAGGAASLRQAPSRTWARQPSRARGRRRAVPAQRES